MQRDTKKLEGFSIFKNIMCSNKVRVCSEMDASEFIPLVERLGLRYAVSKN
jgi:hypothetical protein